MHIEGENPLTKGAVPRRTLLLGALCAALVVSCSSEPRDARTFGPYTVALKSDTPAALESEDGAIFQVRRSIPLPIKPRPPGLPGTAPYPSGVWYSPNEFRVQLSYVITNLEDKEVQVELLVDGWNEFRAYTPQIRIVEDDVQADRSCVQRPIIIPAKGRIDGRVSYDDFERMAIALAGILNKAPNPFHLLDPTVDLYGSPLSKPYIPFIIDGITGFDLSLRSRGGPVRVAVEATVEVIDRAEILMEEGNEGSSTNRRPRDLVPEIAAPPM
jgi:hypothetical protein